MSPEVAQEDEERMNEYTRIVDELKDLGVVVMRDGKLVVEWTRHAATGGRSSGND